MRCLQILNLFLAFTVPAFSQETPAAKLVTALEKLNDGGAIEVRATVSYQKTLLIQGILSGKDFDLAYKAEDGSITRQIALGDHAWLSYDGGKKWKAVEPDDRLVYNIVHSPIRVADLGTLPEYEELETEQRREERRLPEVEEVLEHEGEDWPRQRLHEAAADDVGRASSRHDQPLWFAPKFGRSAKWHATQ